MIKKYSDVFNKAAQKGVFPYQLAFTLLIPLRNIFISPKKLTERLKLKKNHIVLEVGPGPGYFSLAIARAIPDGKLVLADIQAEMLAMSRKRLSAKKIKNVEYHLCNGIDFPFADKEFDRIYMVMVMGEIENQQEYVREFFRILRPNGVLSISEQFGDPDKMSIEDIKILLNTAGFEFDRFYGSENNFTINFRKNTI